MTRPPGAGTDSILELFAAAAETVLPGARELGAVGYAQRLSRDSEAIRKRLDDGLGWLQGLARDLHDRDFVDCTPSERREVLEQLHVIPHRVPRRFLEFLIDLTLTGCFSHPRHGGNADGAGWRFLGYEPKEPLGGDPAPRRESL